MKRYLQLFFSIFALLLVMFLIAEALHIKILPDPNRTLGEPGWRAALIGFALLVSDVLLPIPSSIIIMMLGKLFGTPMGTAISLAGTMGSVIIAFALGRCGGKFIERGISNEERARADSLLKKYGALVIIVTRPIPLLAESVGLVAGTTSMSWRTLLLASLMGNLPACAIYAAAGSVAGDFNSPAVTFGVVLLTAGVFFGIGKLIAKWHVVETEK
jgi:uncharacterized membrane protein YdjX (TVP38/TMEM64 family)